MSDSQGVSILYRSRDDKVTIRITVQAEPAQPVTAIMRTLTEAYAEAAAVVHDRWPGG